MGRTEGCGESAQTWHFFVRRGRRRFSAIHFTGLFPIRVIRSGRRGLRSWDCRNGGDCLRSCTLIEAVWFASSAHDGQRGMSKETMKKVPKKNGVPKPVRADEILPEYDFSRGVRNKYASRYTRGSAVVVLEPDVAAVFPTSSEANDALRAIARIVKRRRR